MTVQILTKQRFLGSLALLIFTGCASAPPKVGQVSNDGKQMSLQLSRDGKSLLAAKPNRDAIVARDELKRRKELTTTLLNSIAELSLVGGNPDEAALLARTQLKKDFKNTEALKTLVKVALFNSRYEEAILMADNGLAQQTRSADLLSLRGVAHYMLGDTIEAREDWKKAVELNPGYIAAQMNLSALYFHNGNISLAGGGFEKVLALQPQNLDAQVGRALVLSLQGNHEESRRILNATLQKNPKSPLVLYNLSVLERDRFQNYEKSLEYIDSHIELANLERFQVERAINIREDLRRVIAAKTKEKLSDAQLRKIANKSTQAISSPEQAQPENLASVNSSEGTNGKAKAQTASSKSSGSQPARVQNVNSNNVTGSVNPKTGEASLPSMTKETEDVNALENAIK